MKASLLLVILTSTACGVASTQQRPASYYENQPSNNDTSIFNEGAEYSDEAIQKILSFRLTLPAKNRIAILDISDNYRWNGPQAILNNDIAKLLYEKLNASERVYDASALPSLLVPRERKVENLRGAAARYQADLLLVYQAKCQTFENYNLFDPNVTKAYCTVKSLVLDTRSGIVAFTFLATNEFTVEEKSSHTNFRETILKAEMKAIGTGLGQVAEKLNGFLQTIPIQTKSVPEPNKSEEK